MRLILISAFLLSVEFGGVHPKDNLPLLNVAKLPAGGMDALPPAFAASFSDPKTSDTFNKDDKLFPMDDQPQNPNDEAPSLAKVFSLNRDGDLPPSLSESAINEAAQGNSHKNSTVVKAEDDCLPKVDLVFLLDTSGSIEQLYQEHVRWAVALVESLPIEEETVRVAAVQYAGFPLTEFALGTYPNAGDIRRHLAQINAQSGVTRTGYALRKAEAELFREDRGARHDAKKVIVLFTDGLSIDDPLKPAQQLRDLKGVIIYVVSVSADGAGFAHEMNRIAGSRANVFGPDDLPRLREALIAEAERARACTRVGAVKSNFFEDKSPAFKIATSARPSTTSATATTTIAVTTSTTLISTTTTSSSPSLSTEHSRASEATTGAGVTESEQPALDESAILAELAPLSDIAEDILLLNALNEENGTAQRAVIAPSAASSIATDMSSVSTVAATTSTADADDVEGSGVDVTPEELAKVEKIAAAAKSPFPVFAADAGSETRDVFEIGEARQRVRDEFTPAPKSTTSSSTTAATFVRPLPRVTFETVRAATIIPPQVAPFSRRPSLTVDVSSNKGVFTPRFNTGDGSATPKRNPLKNDKGSAQAKKLAAITIPTTSLTNRASTPTGPSWRFRQTSTVSSSKAPTTLAPRSTTQRRTTEAVSSTSRAAATATANRFSSLRTTVATATSAPTTRRPTRLFAAQLAAQQQFQQHPRPLSSDIGPPAASVKASPCPADWLFIVDSSGSVQKIYDAQKEYLNDVLDEIQLDERLAGHRVALLQFAGSDIQKMEWSYEAYRSHDSLMNAFQQVRHITGTTYIGAALEAAALVLESRRRNVPSVIVLLSDGFSQDDVSRAAEVMRRQPNTDIYALSIAELSNTEILNEITGRAENVFVGGEGASALRHLLTNRLQCRAIPRQTN